MIEGKTFDNRRVYAKDDGLIYNKLLSDGVITGFAVTIDPYTSGSSRQNIRISAGAFMACGRLTVLSGTTTIEVSAPSQQNYCLLIYEIDTTKINTYEDFRQGEFKVLKNSSATPGYVQEDINNSGYLYQLPIASFRTGSGGITSLKNVLGVASASGSGGNRNLLDNAWFTIEQFPGYYANAGTTYYTDEALTTIGGTISEKVRLLYGENYGYGHFMYYVDGNNIYYFDPGDCVKGYCYLSRGICDRWLNIVHNNRDTMIINTTSHGLYLERTAQNVESEVVQIITPDVINIIKGRTVTISAIVNGTLHSGTMMVPDDVSTLTSWNPVFEAEGWSFGLIYGADELQFIMYSTAQFSHLTIRAVKLEVGSRSTLKDDIMPDYTAELFKCKRYLQSIDHAIHRYGSTANAGWYFATGMALPVPMVIANISDPTSLINNMIYRWDQHGKIGKILETDAELAQNTVAGSGREATITVASTASSVSNRTVHYYEAVVLTKYSLPYFYTAAE